MAVLNPPKNGTVKYTTIPSNYYENINRVDLKGMQSLKQEIKILNDNKPSKETEEGDNSNKINC